MQNFPVQKLPEHLVAPCHLQEPHLGNTKQQLSADGLHLLVEEVLRPSYSWNIGKTIQPSISVYWKAVFLKGCSSVKHPIDPLQLPYDSLPSGDVNFAQLHF